jgi:hypothetical protein
VRGIAAQLEMRVTPDQLEGLLFSHRLTDPTPGLRQEPDLPLRVPAGIVGGL